MLEAGDLNKLFRDCMPLFIALGDEVRLSIIGVLAGSGLYDDYETDIAVSLNGYRPSGTDESVAARHFPSFKNFKRCRTGQCTQGRDFQLLLSDDCGQHKRTAKAWELSPGASGAVFTKNLMNTGNL